MDILKEIELKLAQLEETLARHRFVLKEVFNEVVRD